VALIRAVSPLNATGGHFGMLRSLAEVGKIYRFFIVDCFMSMHDIPIEKIQMFYPDGRCFGSVVIITIVLSNKPTWLYHILTDPPLLRTIFRTQ